MNIFPGKDNKTKIIIRKICGKSKFVMKTAHKEHLMMFNTKSLSASFPSVEIKLNTSMVGWVTKGYRSFRKVAKK